MIRLAFLALVALLASASPAGAVPVAAVAAVLSISATSFAAIAATFVVNTVLSMGLNVLANKLFGPDLNAGPAEAAQDRQASVTNLNIGEVSREMVIGETANGGSLSRAFNYGGEYGTDHVVKVVVVADHRCAALKSVFIDDNEVIFGGDGPVADYNNQLSIYWRDGSEGQLFPEHLWDAWRASPLHGHTAPESRSILTGCAYIVFDYTADAPDAETPVWGGNHPQFLPVIRGKRCYDPRKDSTVPGGFGEHRWDDPDTWEWTRNLAIVRYNWVRGSYYLDRVGEPQSLLVGRGLSHIEAPPQRVFAAANLCDELVDDGDGGTEPRYFADGVIRASQPFDQVEQMFAAACGGQILQPEGGVEVEPGQAKTPVIQITDDNLVVGTEVEFEHFASDATRVNTVIARYIEPSQRYADIAAPVLRDLLDVQAEGPREETLSLALVNRVTQAVRVGEMKRRQYRLQRSAKITLGPWFAEVEEGDWIQWTSKRHTKNQPVVFRVGTYALDHAWQNSLALSETAFSVYGFGGMELPPAGGYVPTVPPGALVLQGVTAQAIQIEGDETLVPAVRFGWTAPVDAAVTRIRAEIRAVGMPGTASTTTDAVNDGALIVTNGVPVRAAIEVRLVPLGDAGRPIVPSPWFALTTGDLSVPGITTIGGMTPEQLVAELRYVAAQGKALVNASMETLLRIQEERAALFKEVYHEGLHVKTIVLDEIEERTEGQSLILSRMNLLGAVTDDGSAWVLNEATVKVSPTETFAQFRNSLVATFQSVQAAIVTESEVRASQNEALATSISTVSTTVGGHTASITNMQTSLNGLSAQWVLSVSAGRVAGMKLAANPTVSSIIFSADQIGFTNGTTNLFPLSVVGSEVWATTLRVGAVFANTIVTDSIVANNIVETVQGANNSTTTLPNGTPITLVSVPAHVPRGKVTLKTLVNISNAGGECTALVELRRDGATIDSYVEFCEGAWGNNAEVWEVDDNPPAGWHTYSVVVTRNYAGGGPISSTRARATVELRKTEG